MRYHITGSSEAEATIKEQPGPGRGNRGLAATEFCLTKTTAKSRQTAEAIAVRRLLPGQWQCGGWVATANGACMQGQANCLLDEPPGATASAMPDELQWHLPPCGNRTQLKGVTVDTNTLQLQMMEQS